MDELFYKIKRNEILIKGINDISNYNKKIKIT